jgi:hypothetical protein
MSEITRTPLCWPDNVPRTPPHLRGNPQFKERTLAAAADFVLAEINRLNNRRWNESDPNVIISSNLRLRNDGLPYSDQRQLDDTGIAVYFKLKFRRGGQTIERPIVLTCDKWRKIADNLYAIGKDIEAQRARDRWGCTNFEQAFRGYLAIPERCGGAPWWETLGVKPDANEEQIKAAYRQKALKQHPDKGGDREKWNKVQEATDQALQQFGT